ncbi:YciI family protein [Phyllobacterium lublinensis]|uniref:YciI family protein n=1 Tax=Phyllobacterium lublinensis TaxID=2875708 RepID=UPI001CCCB036|nr:YciI family protein [Phyllobacterium sp. 2063]MBZ9654344.1 YciI family protein [Phyllobacterium sp. 2063]
MFIVSLTYVVPLEDIDAGMPAHVAFLEKHYATGTFLASGVKVPRVGGVILARAPSEDALSEILAQDPFHQKKMAYYDVHQFTPSRTQKGLEALLE